MRRSRSCKLLLFGGRCVKVHGCLSLRTKLLLLLLLLLQWNRARSTIQNTESSLYPHRLFTPSVSAYTRGNQGWKIFSKISKYLILLIFVIFSTKWKFRISYITMDVKRWCSISFQSFVPYVSLLSVIALSLRKFFSVNVNGVKLRFFATVLVFL